MLNVIFGVFRLFLSIPIFLKIILLWRLGLTNIYRVILHRYRLRHSFYEKAQPIGSVVNGTQFWMYGERIKTATISEPLRLAMLARADEILVGKFRSFEDTIIDEGIHPQWHKMSYVNWQNVHYSQVKINGIPGEDIKLCWDLSRFKWLTQLALGAIASPCQKRSLQYRQRGDVLLEFWVRDNGYFKGGNWACGQEVSIRGLHLMITHFLYESYFESCPTKDLLNFLHASYKRVALTIGYSLAQENNHSLTESLFLFYCHIFLAKYGVSCSSNYSRTKIKHLKRLQAVCAHLIQNDGSFAMYSTNYHRAVCDLLSLSKVVDDGLNVGFWSIDENERRVKKMHAFLSSLVDPLSGGAPNIGHNDGSLHAVQYSSYADYSPSVVLMGSVFGLPICKQFCKASEAIYCFGYASTYVDINDLKTSAVDSKITFERYDDFGLMIVKTGAYRAYFKYARNKFRPHQEDFLHLDLWVHGVNIVGDSGTYSYNPVDTSLVNYFDGASAHNGPFLCGKQFVKKVTRFLYLEWPAANVNVTSEFGCLKVRAQIKNFNGSLFTREILYTTTEVDVMDYCSEQAWVISYNLFAQPTRIDLDGVEFTPKISFETDGALECEKSFYSKNYLQRDEGVRLIVRKKEKSSMSIKTKWRVQDPL